MVEVTSNFVGSVAAPVRGDSARQFTACTRPAAATRRRPRGFSLVEILLAIMILGVGLVMVASVFPVGATWTRQTAEETVAGIVARNAVSIIQAKYTLADLSFSMPVPVGTAGATFSTLPGIGDSSRLPAIERAYDFGRGTPYPAANPGGALYWWTAVVRRSNVGKGVAAPPTSNLPDGMRNSFDVYIMVFKKGAVEQIYTPQGAESPLGRDETNDKPIVPFVVSGLVADARFRVGSQGIGVLSGTVFRKIGTNTTNAALFGNNPSGEQVIYAPPADGTSASPLVYIYQTTIAF